LLCRDLLFLFISYIQDEEKKISVLEGGNKISPSYLPHSLFAIMLSQK
jgi:hypothetical protein